MNIKQKRADCSTIVSFSISSFSLAWELKKVHVTYELATFPANICLTLHSVNKFSLSYAQENRLPSLMD